MTPQPILDHLDHRAGGCLGIAAVVVGLAANAAFIAWLKGHH